MTFLTTLPPDLKTLAAPADPAKTEEMVARRTRLDPPRPREVAGKDTAECTPSRLRCRYPVKRAPIGRLEGEHLPRLCERGLDLGERRCGAGGQDQLARLIFADAGQPGQVERTRQLQRPAEPALRAAGDDLHRLLGGERVTDRVAQFAEVGRGGLGHGSDRLVVQTRRPLPGGSASRLLSLSRRNDIVSACHCEEYSDEAISVKVRTGGNHLSGLHY